MPLLYPHRTQACNHRFFHDYVPSPSPDHSPPAGLHQGLALIHFSPQPERFLSLKLPNYPSMFTLL